MKLTYLLALALCALPSVASAAVVELDCADDNPTQAHQSVVLNQDTRSATTAWIGLPGSTMDHPAAFSPNEVAITISKSVGGIVALHYMSDTLYIDRTTLRWHEVSTIDGSPATKGLSGQCQIVTNPNRRI